MAKYFCMLLLWLFLGSTAFAQSSFDDINALPKGDESVVTDPALDAPPAPPISTAVTTTPTSTSKATTTTSTTQTGPELIIFFILAAVALLFTGYYIRAKKYHL